MMGAMTASIYHLSDDASRKMLVMIDIGLDTPHSTLPQYELQYRHWYTSTGSRLTLYTCEFTFISPHLRVSFTPHVNVKDF